MYAQAPGAALGIGVHRGQELVEQAWSGSRQLVAEPAEGPTQLALLEGFGLAAQAALDVTAGVRISDRAPS